jgi:hypothetical protein
MSHSRDQKTFPAFGNAKVLLLRDSKSSLTWGNVKKSMNGGKNVLVSAAGLSIIGN